MGPSLIPKISLKLTLSKVKIKSRVILAPELIVNLITYSDLYIKGLVVDAMHAMIEQISDLIEATSDLFVRSCYTFPSLVSHSFSFLVADRKYRGNFITNVI